MKRTLRRLTAVLLSTALLAGMFITASAFTYPSAYWKLHSAWEEAVTAQDTNKVISVAQQTHDLLSQYEICQDICFNLEPKCARAAWCSEINGDIDGAIRWLELQRKYAQWLNDNVRSYQDTLINIDARLKHLKAAAELEIYAFGAGEDSPYDVGPSQGVWYGRALNDNSGKESATLAYITFQDGYSVEYWLDYYDIFASFRDAAQGGVLELAWNFSPESTAGAQNVLSASADSYIKEGVAAMGALNATVLLRVGAEMNNWSDCDPSTYIQAFRKIATEARKYSNIQMVFSPDNISNRSVTVDDFYPGDAYVDWIGVSTYQTNNYAGTTTSYAFNAGVYGNDAYYGQGIYDNDPMIVLQDVINLADKHGKPLMISECGFAYYDNRTGTDLTTYAADQMNKFYSYVNMVYPQVKAVFFFDTNISGGNFQYALSGNSTIARTYETAIASNGGYLQLGQTEIGSWQPLEEFQPQPEDDVLRLATYASFPGTASSTTSVTYYVDGKSVYQTSSLPFYFDLDLSTLTPGKHTITATAKSGQFTRTTQSYTVNVPWPEGVFSDVQDAHWFKGFVDKVVDAGLMSGMGDGLFGPGENLKVSQALVLAYQIHSQANGGGTLPQASGAWYMPYYQYCLNNEIITAQQVPQSMLEQTATRFDMVSILDKAIPESRMEAVKEVADGDIPDLAEGGAYGDIVYRWYRAGLVSGSDDQGSFLGETGINRAQVAVILCQINRLV